MWHLLIPLFISTNTTGPDTAIFKEWRSTATDTFIGIEISGKTKSRLSQGKDCGVPFWIDTADNTLISFRFRIEDTANCKFKGFNSDLPSSYPLFYFTNYNILYSIDSTALRGYKSDSKTFSHLLLLYDDNLVIRHVEGIPKSSLRTHWANQYQAVQGDSLISFNKGFVKRPRQLRKIIHDIYSMDCCYRSDPDSNCIPFGSVLSGCESRAQQIAHYLNTTGFEYVLIDLDHSSGVRTSSRRILQTIPWGHHIAAAVRYRSKKDYIMLDPTVLNFDSVELAEMFPHYKPLSRKTWEAKFSPNSINGNEIESLICEPPDFICGKKPMYMSTEQIQRARRHGISQLQFICTCYTDFPDYFE